MLLVVQNVPFRSSNSRPDQKSTKPVYNQESKIQWFKKVCDKIQYWILTQRYSQQERVIPGLPYLDKASTGLTPFKIESDKYRQIDYMCYLIKYSRIYINEAFMLNLFFATYCDGTNCIHDFISDFHSKDLESAPVCQQT